MREKLIELMCDAKYDVDRICIERDWCDGCPAEYGEGQCKEVYIADHLIANGITVQEWIPVTERLPEEDGQYLVVKTIFNNSIWQDVLSFAKDGRKVDKYDFHRGWKNVWYYYDSEWGHIAVDSVTHWMPLPEAPKGE